MPSASSESLVETQQGLHRDEIVRAGAGAGKTYALTHKVMDIADVFLSENKKFPRMIVTTFTRKATQELRERLMLLALEERPQLIDFMNSRSHLVVSTIHGIMDLYLKRYGANIGIDPSYRIIASSEATKLARQISRRLVFKDSECHEILELFQFNSLVFLMREIDRIVAENPSAEPFRRDDFQTLFARSAAQAREKFQDAAARIRQQTEKETWLEMAVCCETFVKLLGTGDWSKHFSQFKMTYEAMPIARRSGKGVSPVDETTMELVKEARRLAGDLCENIYDPAVWELFSIQYAKIAALSRRFVEEFRRAKLTAGVLEIGDLEHLAMSCLRLHPQTAEAFQSEWDFWLVDEYQDTSPFQVELLRHLSGTRPSYIVGDPQQSIYLFRGARTEVFSKRTEEVLAGGGQQRFLTMNRRSRPELLLFLNDFFSQLQPPFQSMEPFVRPNEPIVPSRMVAKIFIGHQVNPTDGESPEEDDASSEKAGEEMQAMVAHVQSLLNQGVSPEDICILARTNGNLSMAAEWLGRSNLPTHVHAAAGFYDRREIRDAIALLKFLCHPHDDFNLLEILRSPWFRVPDAILTQTIGYAKAAKAREPGLRSLWESLSGPSILSEDWSAVRRLQGLLHKAQHRGFAEAFREGLIESGFIDLARRHDLSGRRESNLWKIISRLQVEERQPGFNPITFIAQTSGDIKLSEGNSEGDAVAAVEPNRINLMTVHASKGLEFKHIVLPRMDQRPTLTTHEAFTFDEERCLWAHRVPFGDDRNMTQSLPEAKWLESFRAQELAEHARVLYVALTRASESLFLSWTAPAKTNSWAAMVPIELSPGIHQRESYCYFVEDSGGLDGGKLDANGQRPEGAPVIGGERSAVSPANELPSPRSRWCEVNAFNLSAETELSVTELIDRHAVGKGRSSGKEKLSLATSFAYRSRGTLTHKLMELIKYRDPTQMESLIARWFVGQEAEALAALRYVLELKAPPLKEIILNGEVEKSFVLVDGETVIPGQIDLWGQTDAGEPWIVDYKTGNPSDSEAAFAQMEIYALAIDESGWLKPGAVLQLAAVFPYASEVQVRTAPSADTIRRKLRSQH